MSSHWLFDGSQGRDYLIRLYHEMGWSIRQIAEFLETDKMVVAKAMVHHRIPRRGKSEAQAGAIKNGRSKNPTAGRERTEREKKRISRGHKRYWDNLPPEEREKRIAELNRQLDDIRRGRQPGG